MSDPRDMFDSIRIAAVSFVVSRDAFLVKALSISASIIKHKPPNSSSDKL